SETNAVRSRSEVDTPLSLSCLKWVWVSWRQVHTHIFIISRRNGLVMKLFNNSPKPKSKPAESQTNKRNELELNNKELQELVANSALSVLKQDKQYDNLSDVTVEFGYLFSIDGHGLEGLLKIKANQGTFYFAAQKNSIQKLNITEELFKGYTETFLEIHG
ncbi:MAG: hypothetical protein FWH57_04115, partial [Oscillospiraceae bacterium]|nr:hypothetical protein [Oscillospiraceae bacterium]